MIVRNEALVIRRALQSIKPFISSWVIIDTGSRDGTQEIIKNELATISGYLHESSWVHFSYHRNQALQFSKDQSDYILFLDADEEFLPDSGFSFSFLEDDYYLGNFFMGDGKIFSKVLLIQNSPYFSWIGEVHEMIVNRRKVCHGKIVSGVKIAYHSGGYRSRDPLTFSKDASLLKEAIKKRPDDSRSLFFLALTYVKLQKWSLALECFSERVTREERDQEVFYSFFSLGAIQMQLGVSWKLPLKNLEKAHQLIPSRPEPPFLIASLLQSQGELQKAYDLLSPFVHGYDRSNLGYQLFLHLKVSEIDLPILYGSICCDLYKYKEAQDVFLRLCSRNDLSLENRNQVEGYLAKIQCKKKI